MHTTSSSNQINTYENNRCVTIVRTSIVQDQEADVVCEVVECWKKYAGYEARVINPTTQP